MQSKNLVVYTYNMNASRNALKKISPIKKSSILIAIILLLFFTFCFSIIADFNNAINSDSNKNENVAKFESDINILNEIARISEDERLSNNDLNSFGSDGIVISPKEIRPALKAALINLGDTDNDRKLSDEELSSLQIMRLDKDDFQKELKDYQYTLSSPDCNLKNYLVVTQGKYAGTILYNGPFKYVDSEHKQYLGLDLFNNA